MITPNYQTATVPARACLYRLFHTHRSNSPHNSADFWSAPGNLFSGRRRSGVNSSLFTGMPRLSVSHNTISLSSDCFVATVDTFITNISVCQRPGQRTGRSKRYEYSPQFEYAGIILGKSVSLPARFWAHSFLSYPYTRGYFHRHPSSVAMPVPTGVIPHPFETPSH